MKCGVKYRWPIFLKAMENEHPKKKPRCIVTNKEGKPYSQSHSYRLKRAEREAQRAQCLTEVKKVF